MGPDQHQGFPVQPLERISNRCAAVSAVSAVVGAFDRLELANKLFKSDQGHRQSWVDPARLFKNRACSANGRAEIASTRRTYPPPCPPPQGGRKRFWKHEVQEKAHVYSRSFCPFNFLWIEKNFMIRVTLPPPLWGRAGWGVPKNKIAALKKLVSYRPGSDIPIGKALLFGVPLPSQLLTIFLQPMFLKFALRSICGFVAAIISVDFQQAPGVGRVPI